MVRPVRIPQAGVGSGAPAALPSIAAQTAPAQAAAGIGNAAAGAIGGLSRDVLGRADSLAYVRQATESSAILQSEIAAAESALSDYVQSPQYDPDDYVEMRTARYEDAYERAMEGVTHPRVRATLEGSRDGDLAANTDALLKQNLDTRDAIAVGDTGSKAISYLEAGGPLVAESVVEAAAGVLGEIEARNPELRAAVQREKSRIWEGVKTSYMKDGVSGEVDFYVDLRLGAFDPLGLDTLGRDAKDAPERLSRAIGELADAALNDDDFGVLTEGSGRFPTFTQGPGVTELEAIKMKTEGLPEFEGQEVRRGLQVAIDRRKRRQKSMDLVHRYYNEGIRLSRGDWGNEDLLAAHDHYFENVIGPYLTRQGADEIEGMPIVRDVLRRSVIDRGFVTQAERGWILGVTESADPVPGAFMGIAQALASVDPALPPAVGKREEGEPLGAALDTSWIPKVTKDRIRYLAERGTQLPSSALQAAYAFEESQRKGSLSGAVNAPVSKAAAKEAQKKAAEVEASVRRVIGGQVDQIGVNVQKMILEDGAAETQRLMQAGWPEEEATRSGMDFAARKVLDANPPVTLWGRSYLSKPIHDLTEGGKYTTRMIEIEFADAFSKLGYDVAAGDFLERVYIWQEDGMGPNEFHAALLGTDSEPAKPLLYPEGHEHAGAPARIEVRGEKAIETQMRTVGQQLMMVEAGKGAKSEEAQAAWKEDVFRGLLSDRGEFISRYLTQWETGSSSDAVGVSIPRQGALGPTISAEAREKLNTQWTRVPEGAPMIAVRPKLYQEWQREYETAYSNAVKPWFRILGHGDGPTGIGGIPVYRRMPDMPDEMRKQIARESANKAIMGVLMREFEGAKPESVMRFLETGLFPREPAGTDVGDPLGGSKPLPYPDNGGYNWSIGSDE